MARKKRRSTTTRRRRKTTAVARRKKNPSSAKRKAAARKAARTRATKKAARSRAAKKAAATRKRRRRNPTKRRKTVRAVSRKRRRNPARKRRTARAAAPKRRRRRRRRNPAQTRGLSTMSRARRTYKNRKRKGRGLLRSYIKKHNIRMKSNPASLMDAAKMVVPMALSMYASRMLSGFIVNKVGDKLSMLRVGEYDLSKATVSTGLFVGTFYGTKKLKGKAGKYRASLVLGSALNMIDSLVSTFAPDDVLANLGMSKGAVVSAPASAEDYVQIGEYMGIGDAPPIDDDITLSDYIEIGAEEDLGALEAELGSVEAELGLMEDLGSTGGFANRHLGGVHRNQMLRQVPQAQMVAPIPDRSFTKKIPQIGAGYDSHLNQGIFKNSW